MTAFDKNWEEMTAEEQKTQELNLTVAVIDHRKNIDLITQFEVSIALIGSPDIFYTYFMFGLLQQLGWLHDSTQDQIAAYLGYSSNSYKTYRDRLEQLHFITIKRKWRTIYIELNELTPLPKIKTVIGFDHRIKYLTELKKLVTAVTPEVLQKEQAIKEARQEQLLMDQQVEERANVIVKKKEEVKKKEAQKFPVQDYQSVIDGYRKYKGVYLQRGSPDEMRVRKAAKQMFLSGHKVFDILQCMKFFKQYANEEGYEWMGHWTIETIMKKMPEFKAGKLKLPEIGDDLPDL